MTNETPIVSYKGFDKDMKCRNFQYEVGGTYEHYRDGDGDGSIRHIRASKVGENGIRPGVWYTLSDTGEFVEA